MEYYNENIQYENPFLSMKIFESSRDKEKLGPWHYHKELEILVIIEGRLDIYVEDEFKSIQAGDVLLIGSSQLHRDRSLHSVQLRYLVFQFDIQPYFEQSAMPYYPLFSEAGFPFNKLNYIMQENSRARETVYHCVKEIYDETLLKTNGYEIAVSMLIKKIVLTLIRNDNRRLLHSRENAEILRLRPVLDYIERNLSEKIQVEEASRIANISYFYFVKFFKKTLGMSFLEYVNFQKIKRAERILLTNTITIAEVGEAIGMPNMAHFYKMFKKYNDCSPKQFRQKMLDWIQ
jgi:AraC-like DNA-binding protein/mannose-6-phosphate isomerase-like protein (cupin superfamily)